MPRGEVVQKFLSDQEVAARVLEHIEAGTTDVGSRVHEEPVTNYVAEERFQAEIHRVLRRTPTPFCPSAALPQPGSFVARRAAGVSLLAARDEDGRVRVFRNACRHRGTEVARGSGCTRSFVCPYHAWTYRLSGELSHVPHDRGFPGLVKDELPLVEVPSREEKEMIVVNQDGGGDAWEELPEVIAPGQRLLAATETMVHANWKVALEGFIEGYHIRGAHPESFYPFGYDNVNVVELVGRHSRVTYPFRRIEKLRDVAPAERDVRGLLTYVYHLFPNVLVAVLSHHTNLVVLEPVAIDRTNFVTYTMTNVVAGTPEQEARAKRDAEFVNDTGGAEDRALVESIQRAIDSGANEVFRFGHFEAALSHFHAQLAAALSR